MGSKNKGIHPGTEKMYKVYILLSLTKLRYYVGHTISLENRLLQHNSGQTKSTRYGIPWKVIWTKDFSTRAEAMKKENEIKKRGIARFLETIKIADSIIQQLG